ncbi:uncharacterized protein LOC144583288 [Pogona vitticeps]
MRSSLKQIELQGGANWEIHLDLGAEPESGWPPPGLGGRSTAEGDLSRGMGSEAALLLPPLASDSPNARPFRACARLQIPVAVHLDSMNPEKSAQDAPSELRASKRPPPPPRVCLSSSGEGPSLVPPPPEAKAGRAQEAGLCTFPEAALFSGGLACLPVLQASQFSGEVKPPARELSFQDRPLSPPSRSRAPHPRRAAPLLRSPASSTAPVPLTHLSADLKGKPLGETFAAQRLISEGFRLPVLPPPPAPRGSGGRRQRRWAGARARSLGPRLRRSSRSLNPGETAFLSLSGLSGPPPSSSSYPPPAGSSPLRTLPRGPRGSSRLNRAPEGEAFGPRPEVLVRADQASWPASLSGPGTLAFVGRANGWPPARFLPFSAGTDSPAFLSTSPHPASPAPSPFGAGRGCKTGRAIPSRSGERRGAPSTRRLAPGFDGPLSRLICHVRPPRPISPQWHLRKREPPSRERQPDGRRGGGGSGRGWGGLFGGGRGKGPLPSASPVGLCGFGKRARRRSSTRAGICASGNEPEPQSARRETCPEGRAGGRARRIRAGTNRLLLPRRSRKERGRAPCQEHGVKSDEDLLGSLEARPKGRFRSWPGPSFAREGAARLEGRNAAACTHHPAQRLKPRGQRWVGNSPGRKAPGRFPAARPKEAGSPTPTNVPQTKAGWGWGWGWGWCLSLQEPTFLSSGAQKAKGTLAPTPALCSALPRLPEADGWTIAFKPVLRGCPCSAVRSGPGQILPTCGRAGGTRRRRAGAAAERQGEGGGRRQPSGDWSPAAAAAAAAGARQEERGQRARSGQRARGRRGPASGRRPARPTLAVLSSPALPGDAVAFLSPCSRTC